MMFQLAVCMIPLGVGLACSGIMLGMEEGMSNRRASIVCSVLAALAFLLAPVLAHAQTPNLECKAGDTCTVTVVQSASPDVDQVCLKEVARPDRTAPVAGVFLECKDTAPGATQTFRLGPLALNAPSLYFAAVSRDLDYPTGPRESDLSSAKGSVLAPIAPPTLRDLLSQAAAALRQAADSLAQATQLLGN